jgi:hypothetical protein
MSVPIGISMTFELLIVHIELRLDQPVWHGPSHIGEHPSNHEIDSRIGSWLHTVTCAGTSSAAETQFSGIALSR